MMLTRDTGVMSTFWYYQRMGGGLRYHVVRVYRRN